MLPFLATPTQDQFEQQFKIWIIIFLVCLIVFLIVIFVCVVKCNNKKAILLELIDKKLDIYKTIELGMDENQMLSIMDMKYDLTRSEIGNSYRFVFKQRGGYGRTNGGLTGWNGKGINMAGFVSGYQEQHDESVVIIDCQNNKVIKIAPYNMSSFNMSSLSSYNSVVEFAKYLNIQTD